MSYEPTRRAKVRDAVVALLKAGVPAVKKRVYSARTWPVQVRDMPGLLVYGWQEEKKRTSISAVETSFDVNLILVVEIVLSDRSRDSEESERDLDELTGIVTDLVMGADILRGVPNGLIEHIDGVKTTLGVDTRSSELALGRAHVAFDMKWSEVFEAPLPAVDCEDAFVTFTAIPPPPKI